MNREPEAPVAELKRAFQKLQSAHLNLVYALRGLDSEKQSELKRDVRELLDQVVGVKGRAWDIYEKLGGHLLAKRERC